MSSSDPNLSSIAKALEAISKQLELIHGDLELIHGDLERVNSDPFKRPQQTASNPQTNDNAATEEGQQAANASSRSSASRFDPSIAQNEETREKYWNVKYWKSQLGNVRFAEWLEILGIVVLIGYTTVTFLQLRAANESNRFSQRASVNVGLPSGEVANFIQDGAYLEVYARNDGTTAARQTHIEIFPSTVFSGDTQVQTIPAFPGWGEEQRITGIAVPPGVTFTRFHPYDSSLFEAVKGGRAVLSFYGRISYVDRFGRYCAPFSAMYSRPLDRFFAQRDPCR